MGKPNGNIARVNQPEQDLGNGESGTPEMNQSTMGDKEWHKDVDPELRNNLISKLLLGILPASCRTLIRGTPMNNLIDRGQRLENDAYLKANSRKEYALLLMQKIQLMRGELATMKLNRVEKVQTESDKTSVTGHTALNSVVEDMSKVSLGDANTTRMQELTKGMSQVDISKTDTKHVELLTTEPKVVGESAELKSKGPMNGLPVAKQSMYTRQPPRDPQFRPGSTKKRSCEDDGSQSYIYRRSTREPEENDESYVMSFNNLNGGYKINNTQYQYGQGSAYNFENYADISIDLDSILQQPSSPEHQSLVKELNNKVCERNRHLSTMTGSPSSSSDASAMSPQSTITEIDMFDPKGWSQDISANVGFSQRSCWDSDAVRNSQIVPSPGLVSSIGSPYGAPSPSSFQSAPSPSPSFSDLSDEDQAWQDVIGIMEKEVRKIDERNRVLDDALSIFQGEAESIDATNKVNNQTGPLTPDSGYSNASSPSSEARISELMKQPKSTPVTNQPTVITTLGSSFVPPTTTILTVLPAPASIQPRNIILIPTQTHPVTRHRHILPKKNNLNDADKIKMPPPVAPQKPSQPQKFICSTPLQAPKSIPVQNQPCIDQKTKAYRKVAQLSIDQLTLPDVDGDTTLMICACRGEPTIVEAICERSQREPHTEILNQQNKMDQTSVYLATSENHPAVVKTLVEYGANVNLSAKIATRGISDKVAPIHVASEHGERYHQVLLELLKAKDIEVDIQTRDEGLTALHKAVMVTGTLDPFGNRTNSKPIVETLIKAGARPDMGKKKDGKTPIHIAVEMMDSELLKHMINSMSSNVVNTLNKPMFNGNTALHIAAGLSNKNALCVQQQRKIIDILLKNGANREAKNQYNDRPYSVASNQEVQTILRGGQPQQRQIYNGRNY